MIGRRRSSIAETHCTSPPDASPTSCCRSFPRRKLRQNHKSTREDEVMLRRTAAVALAICGLFAFPMAGSAQQYPSRTVTIIVPYPAGGPTDETARIVANFLSKKFGQNFIVENVTGGSTIIATGRVANAAPDGYTLLLHNLQITANVTLIKNLPFDTEK